MRRVLVIGSGGAGKTTFAARLGERTGLPVIHLDRLYWRPGWTETPKEEWEELVRDVIARDTWILDGNYGGTLAKRLAAADTVVFLDVPRVVCIARVLRRRLRHAGRSRPDVTDGCPERITWEFLRWIWTYPARRRPGVLELLAQFESRGGRAAVLRSGREIEAFVESASTDGARASGTG